MPLHDFKTQPRNRDHALWRFVLALIVAIGLLLVSTVSVKAAWDMYQTLDVATEGRDSAEAELAAIKDEYISIAATLEGFTTERGLEAAVRERFGVVRPGEGEIRIVRPEESDELDPLPETNPFKKLFNVLFN